MNRLTYINGRGEWCIDKTPQSAIVPCTDGDKRYYIGEPIDYLAKLETLDMRARLRGAANLKVVRSVKPYYFYLICEGLKKYEVGKDMPKNSDWNRGVELYCSKDISSFNRIPDEHKERYRKYLGKIGARFVCDEIIDLGKEYAYARKDKRFYDILQASCLTVEWLQQYAPKGNAAAWHIKDPSVYVEPKPTSDFKKPCICPQMPYCPMCKVGGEIIPESEAEFYRMGESCNTEWYCNNYLMKPPQSWCYVEVTDCE